MKKPVLAALALTLLAGPVLAQETPPAPPVPSEQPAPPPPGDAKGAHGHGKFMEEVDGNKDGKISRDEFRAKGDKMFNDSDTNKDGFISREESEAFRKARHDKWKEQKDEWSQKQAKPE